ncbi:hypothetical protein BJ878DRAFT_431771 [Calycina marina]|uniref:MI domain-containing protein n=1 Tax=Calycina marina TaxID=1763456 RepID=A0A9P8CL16_9HELO|nr:hypothetical protein BJ878DRAFT_431771 [Calycina marina]
MSTVRRLKPPGKLAAELGIEVPTGGGGKRSRFQKGSRKEIRKAERKQKRLAMNGPPSQKRHKAQHVRTEAIESEDEMSDFVSPPPKLAQKPKVAREVAQSPAKTKSILKKAKAPEPAPALDVKSRSPSPPPMKRKRKLDKMDWGEEEEIDWYEQALGLKGKKKKKLDEFGDLLGEIDQLEDIGLEEKRKAKAEGNEWLDEKRRKAKAAKIQYSGCKVEVESDDDNDMDFVEDDDDSDESIVENPFSDDEMGDSEGIRDYDAIDAEGEFDGFDSEEEDETPAPRVRENPYVAPKVKGAIASTKYIPPSMRKAATSDTELLTRLRRQTQGLVNRLTEANLIFLLGDIEQLYRDNARQHVTSTLVDLLLTSVCEPTSLPDTLIILPAGFIAAIYKIIGTDFGAQVIQRIVELFDAHYDRAAALLTDGPTSATTDISKETSNLIMLLAEMYNFQVVGSNLIFDYIRQFLGKLTELNTELNTELLLKIIRTSGPQLRQDDPSSLKDIVAMLRPSVASIGEENISVRTKFMIETINDLKNNKMKAGGVASAVTSEHTIRMKKTLGTLNTRTIKASEPLRIGLKDIRESDRKGKWWLVGASWAGKADEEVKDAHAITTKSSSRDDIEESGTTDLAQLAREQRMNTEVRRAIFVAIMSATDFQDAYIRLMKLRLKKKQEFEIPKVLIHCAGAEKSYNPYYTLIAKRLCGDNRLTKSFQFSLWDLFTQMGESGNGEDGPDEDDENALDTRHLVNLAKMFGTLIVEGGLGISVLKNLNLGFLQPKTKIFMEVLLISVLLQSQRQSDTKRDEVAVVNVMLRVKDTPQLITGLQYFIKKVIGRTDIAGGKEEKATIKWACKVCLETLQALVHSDIV